MLDGGVKVQQTKGKASSFTINYFEIIDTNIITAKKGRNVYFTKYCATRLVLNIWEGSS